MINFAHYVIFKSVLSAIKEWLVGPYIHVSWSVTNVTAVCGVHYAYTWPLLLKLGQRTSPPQNILIPERAENVHVVMVSWHPNGK